MCEVVLYVKANAQEVNEAHIDVERTSATSPALSLAPTRKTFLVGVTSRHRIHAWKRGEANRKLTPPSPGLNPALPLPCALVDRYE